MGSTNGKLKTNMNGPNGSDSSIYNSQLAHATFGYVGQFQRKHGIHWELNILKSPIIYLIIAYFPRRHEIYGIGYNNYGELGVGHNDPILRYIKLKEMSQLLDHTSNIYRGYGRFMIKTLFGQLYCCGNNYRGDIGLNRLDLRNSNKFHKIDTNNNMEQFFCNIIGDGVISNHTIISSNYPHSNLYAFGSNRRGQFGNYYDDTYKESNFMPIQILYQQILQQNIFHNENIIKIQTGEYHTLFLTEQGNIFSCGDNLYGQCGQYDVDIKKLNLHNQISNGSSSNRNKKKQKKAYLPVTKIKDLSNIIDISCGSYHNLCINTNGDLFVFGDNPNGQLGVPLYTEINNKHINNGYQDINDNDENIIYKPIKCPYFQQRGIKIAKIDCGNCHSCVIDYDANCWIFGEDKYGQIGTGQNNFLLGISTPYSWNSLKKLNGYLVDQASCGYQHTVILTYLNEIFTFGDNEYNQCSSDSKQKKISNPWLLTRFEVGIDEDCRIEKVFAGSDTTLLIIKHN